MRADPRENRAPFFQRRVRALRSNRAGARWAAPPTRARRAPTSVGRYRSWLGHSVAGSASEISRGTTPCGECLTSILPSAVLAVVSHKEPVPHSSTQHASWSLSGTKSLPQSHPEASLFNSNLADPVFASSAAALPFSLTGPVCLLTDLSRKAPQRRPPGAGLRLSVVPIIQLLFSDSVPGRAVTACLSSFQSSSHV